MIFHTFPDHASQGLLNDGVSTIGGRDGFGRARIVPGAGLTSTGGGSGAACWVEANGCRVAGGDAAGAPDKGGTCDPGCWRGAPSLARGSTRRGPRPAGGPSVGGGGVALSGAPGKDAVEDG